MSSIQGDIIGELQERIRLLESEKSDLESRLQHAEEDLAFHRSSYEQAARMAQIVYDLDRCEHGRHRGDACSASPGCGGSSQGNPHLPPGDTLGYDIGGRPYIAPDGYLKTGRAENWSPHA